MVSQAMLCGGACWVSNEMWFAGCQSWVATFAVNGRARRVLITDAISRPPGTGREPF